MSHPPETQRTADMYPAALIVSLVGIVIAAPYVSPRITYFAVITATLGTGASVWLRRQGWPRFYISWTAGGLFLLTMGVYGMGPRRLLPAFS